MEKNWIVVELDLYNDCGVSGFGCAVGPFTEEEASARANSLNDLDHYATEFRAVKLDVKHWAEK